MRSFRSYALRIPDAYHLDFQKQTGDFYYSKNPSTLEQGIAWSAMYFPRWFYWLFVPDVVALILLLDSIASIIVLFTLLPLSIILCIASNMQRDPYAGQALQPFIVFEAQNLSNPTTINAAHFQALRFWYSGDVEKQIKEATITYEKHEEAKRELGNWKLVISFLSKPINGQLGLDFF